jgi:uncharacterized protein YndB with AHSA1/START domain
LTGSAITWRRLPINQSQQATLKDSNDRSFRHPRHVLTRADLPGDAIQGLRRLCLRGGQKRLHATSEHELAEGEAGIQEFDFRPGGRERFGVKARGTTYRYDALYYDIVPDQRIVYSYEMYALDARISVSVATIEFTKSGAGTALTWTEQGAYLDGIDGAQAPAMRVGGTTEHLDRLTRYLQRHRPETMEF